MPAQVLSSVENNFTKGFVTEFTGLEFPENAATDTDNCVYNLVGDVTRRPGMDFETGYNSITANRTGAAISSFLWNNAGGNGTSKLFVQQVGATLNFYNAGNATTSSGLSAQVLASTVDLNSFKADTTLDVTVECEYSTGNGYLFVYNSSCQPFFCSFDGTSVTATAITVNIRDFTGVIESGNPAVTDRPKTLTNPHLYNLINQGWTQGSPWVATSIGSGPAVTAAPSVLTFTVPAGITGTTIGDQVTVTTVNGIDGPVGFPPGTNVMAGVLSSYSGSSMVITITGDLFSARGYSLGPYKITPYNKGYINTWQTGLANYPSNSDVWWFFKDSNNNFSPLTTVNQVTINSGNAPRGHFIIDAFNQNKSVLSSVSGLTSIVTNQRPRTGAWFQGRVWYTGVDAAQAKTGTADFYSWSSNIYFSQVVTGPEQFGMCHQLNDPTSETLNTLLPTDGGVITIQEAGAIYKLFPVQNGMLVFADNGVWFITGSQGIGFSANDYTVTKISSVRALSSSSFVDVLGLPYFWNFEGIYQVKPQQGGGLAVVPMTVDTILSFYEKIPLSSKKYAKGDYDPINYVINWVYRDTEAADITERYTFNKMLNLNMYNNAFYPYTIDTTKASINGIKFINFPAGINKPSPVMKFITSYPNAGSYNIQMSEEKSTSYVDWPQISGGTNYTSYFVTGYKLHGQAQRRFQMPYIYMYSEADAPTAYKIQSIWDFANSRDSGRWSSLQTIYNNKPYFNRIFRRHRLRGQGIVLQIKVTSVDGQPFDILGWSTYEVQNASV